MQNFVLVIHVITAVSIITFILIQQGKGAEAGASFGAGASQTIFGSSGSWNFFSKVTAILATVFFVTSISLAVIAKQNAAVPNTLLPAIEQFQIDQSASDAASDLPALDSDIPAGDFDVPLNDVPAEQSEIPGL